MRGRYKKLLIGGASTLGATACGLLFADADQVSRDMVDASLKYKRLDGVPVALEALLVPPTDANP